KTGVLEDPFKNNDFKAAPSSITNAPSDLHVTQVTTPSQNYSGELAHIQWTVENLGAPVWTGTDHWQDTVYISPDATFIPERATRLGSFAQPNIPRLGHGDTYTQAQDVRLPKGIDGNFFIYVQVNTLLGGIPLYSVGVFEGTHTDNNIGSAPIPVT